MFSLPMSHCEETLLGIFARHIGEKYLICLEIKLNFLMFTVYLDYFLYRYSIQVFYLGGQYFAC